MAAPVMSNDSIPLPEEVEHLGVPVIGAQGPAMMEDDGLRVLGAPVLVEDRHPIRRGDRAHLSLLSSGAQALSMTILRKDTGALSDNGSTQIGRFASRVTTVDALLVARGAKSRSSRFRQAGADERASEGVVRVARAARAGGVRARRAP